MKTHTLGFIFDAKLSQVLLMQKERPDWQKGRVNGIGGKIESGEESISSIVREVFEETGLQTKKEEWIYIGEIKSDTYAVDVYTLIYKGEFNDASSTTDEEVNWFEVNKIPENAIHNLCWLVPLAIDKIKNSEFRNFSVYY